MSRFDFDDVEVQKIIELEEQERRRVVLDVVAGIIRDKGEPAAREAYYKMLRRGLSDVKAREEIGRVLLGAMWYAPRGRTPDGKDWQAALMRLAAGETAADIYPDE